MANKYCASITDGHPKATDTARDYYNSPDVDAFYHSIWGGEDIHIGIYDGPSDSITTASQRTIERMASTVKDITAATRVLDVGAGYGGAARQLARRYGCSVTCLNLSEVQNERNRWKTRAQGLDHLVNVVDGSFDAMPFPDNSFDLIWSQDAFLHSGDRAALISEISRVLVPERGSVVFTDPMSSDETADAELLTPILARLRLGSLGSPSSYRQEFLRHGFSEAGYEGCILHFVTHYQKVLEELERPENDPNGEISDEHRSMTKSGLNQWIAGGEQGALAWSIFLFRR